MNEVIREYMEVGDMKRSSLEPERLPCDSTASDFGGIDACSEKDFAVFGCSV